MSALADDLPESVAERLLFLPARRLACNPHEERLDDNRPLPRCCQDIVKDLLEGDRRAFHLLVVRLCPGFQLGPDLSLVRRLLGGVRPASPAGELALLAP